MSEDTFEFGPWTLLSKKSHILKSIGEEREKFENSLSLPQFPEMIFADNLLRLTHSSGFRIEFSALDALKLVDAEHDHFKVAVSEAWHKTREGSEHIREVIKPFDWTFTTNYSGTIVDEKSILKIEQTEERIDMEKLKVREKIHFYSDLTLFEDELADNGISVVSVKIRVMPTSFFILLRQHMRVDDVLIRIIDTRIYHDGNTDYILREHSWKESKTEDVTLPFHLLTDPNEVSKYLKVKEERFEKMTIAKLS